VWRFVAAASLAAALFLAAPARADVRPAAAVALGDSMASGEGAGSYEADDACHRSAHASIRTAPLPEMPERLVLACSGATIDDTRAQLDRLREVAVGYDVRLILLSVGANDLGYHDLAVDCAKAYALLARPCHETWPDRVASAIAAVEPRLVDLVAEIRNLMYSLGYGTDSYQLYLQSYPSPVTEDMRYPALTRGLHGCPFRTDDADWVRNTVVPDVSRLYQRVAYRASVPLVDAGPALRGREACANGIAAEQEWANGVRRPWAESLHPNAVGYDQLGRCLGEEHALRFIVVECVRGQDGNLHAVRPPIPS